MSSRNDPRHALFPLGSFVIEPEVTSLLSYAKVHQLVQRHARGDWGRVNAERKKMNEAFAHPKNRSTGASAESVHALDNLLVCIQTRQKGGRRQTHVFLT